MKLLIAHGDDASRLALKLVAAQLPGGDFEVSESCEGVETLDTLLAADSSLVAVIDWDLPGCEGPELCRLVRAYRHSGHPYIILLARRERRLAEGLEAGADDCVRTPVNADELRARINVGRRFAALPWGRVMRATGGDARRPAVHQAPPVPELDALRLHDDEDGKGEGGATFELESILVAR
jgi:DNA-binding response OmpR family regulator